LFDNDDDSPKPVAQIEREEQKVKGVKEEKEEKEEKEDSINEKGSSFEKKEEKKKMKKIVRKKSTSPTSSSPQRRRSIASISEVDPEKFFARRHSSRRLSRGLSILKDDRANRIVTSIKPNAFPSRRSQGELKKGLSILQNKTDLSAVLKPDTDDSLDDYFELLELGVLGGN
jgi:hypothetical protein